MDALALRDESAETLAFEYAHLFSNTPLLGKGSGAQIGFEKTDSGLLAGGVARIDTGLYLNLIFFSDTLEGFANGGLPGWFPGAQSRELAEEVDRRIDEACEAARAETDFREGITLLVGCGIGRAIVDFTSDRQWEDWRFEFVGASDLITLSWLPDFTPLSLWRLLEGQHRVEQAGVELHNINGLLNMVGWARSLGGHLVPHGDLPDEFGDSNIPTFIMIEQNALLQVRYEVATYWDHHVVQNILGRWIGVRKDGGSLFREDQQLPFFMAEERDGSRWLRGVYETVSRTWWCELETPDGTPGHQAYERSKLLKTWMCRIVPVLETAFPELPTGTLLWRSRFEGNIGDWGEKGARSRLTFDDAKSTISVEVDKASRIVSVVADALFEDAIFHPENIAERALVTGAVEGFARLASAKPSADRNDELVQKIAGDVSARQSHAFRAQQFRDFVRDSVWRAPITVDKDDAAILKLGVGWRARRRELGGDIRGKDECTIFLNEIVRLLEDEICEELRSLNRTSVLQFVVMNHESAINDRENWRRTAAAVIALHDDKEAVLQTFAKHESELNAVFQASRLLIEFALCECPVDSGRDPGLRDMSRLMAKVLMVPGIGGWSDAIRWDAMEPRVRITALGDIHADVTFHDAILKPYSRMGVDINVREAVESYAENIEGPNTPQADVSTLAPEFLEAIRQEFGASLDDILKFLDHVEEIVLKANRAIVFVKRSALVEMPGAQPEHVTSLVGFLTFKSRLRWREVPVGYEDGTYFRGASGVD